MMRASVTNCAVIAALIDQPTTRRENRSMTAATYSQPSAVQTYVKSAIHLRLGADASDPPPMKWSDLRYVFDIKEDCNGKEALQARRDRREVAAGRCSGFARPIHGGRNPSDRRERSDLLPVATGVRRVAD